ncbi:MAG: hypothetical protein ABSD58_10400 [Verrucomicrobiia bacterium]|jgi:hypothetical protein
MFITKAGLDRLGTAFASGLVNGEAVRTSPAVLDPFGIICRLHLFFFPKMLQLAQFADSLLSIN